MIKNILSALYVLSVLGLIFYGAITSLEREIHAATPEQTRRTP